ncbi:hypothetical protein MASR2M70_04890 [Bacillota bacterium]
MFEKNNDKPWRNGVYLTTAMNSLEADILESKLRGENIPVVKKYKGAGNAMEIIMGSSYSYPIDLYVPEETLEDAQNIIVAVPLLSDEEPGEE